MATTPPEEDPFNDVTDCDFLHVGCMVQLPAEAMGKHAQESAPQHLALMSQSLVEEIARISNDVGALCQSIENLDGRMAFIEAQLFSLRLVQPGTVIEMRNCNIHFENGKEWVSPPFSTHCNGHKLQFMVTTADAAMLVRCRQLMFACDNGDPLLFRGRVVIQLLNQLGDKNHHDFVYDFSSSGQNGELEDDEEENMREASLPIGQLGYSIEHENHYLVDDCLKFKVMVKALTDCDAED